MFENIYFQMTYPGVHRLSISTSNDLSTKPKLDDRAQSDLQSYSPFYNNLL